MPPIDPRLVRAKRYPVHAAVCCCYTPEMERLLTEDAAFHITRKIPDLELGVLHSACASRPGQPAPEVFYKITKYLIQKGAPLNEKDSVAQTALHYAVCHHFALQLVQILIDSGADLNPRREGDGWTPLHLAAMFGKADVVQTLLEAGAYPTVKGTDGETPEDVAKRYRHHQLADLLHSPRIEFRPKSFPSEFQDLAKQVEKEQVPPQPLKITDALVSWRDDDGNSLLHLAAWKGHVLLGRSFFDSIKGRKLVQVPNRKGAVPLAMAIIAGQDKMVEEFFMNKNSKKLIDPSTSLNDSKENIVHLLVKYAPFVHPKFILKRKDITKENLNSLDASGETILLHCSRRNSTPTIRKILESKNVKDNQLLDLSAKTKEGKNVLHYLVENKDELNFGLLLDRPELTPDDANAVDNQGRTPLITCLLQGSPYMARDILEHPTASEKFRLDLCHTSDGRSPLHLVAEQGNGSLWQLAVVKPDCDMNARDTDGNTPLMRATICGRTKMLETFLRDVDRAKRVDLSLINDEGKNLLMLFVEHIQEIRLLKLFLRTVDFKESVNQVDKTCHTALTIAISHSKWDFVRELLTNLGLKTGDPLQEDTLEGTIDVHPVNDEGQSALTMMVLARTKLARQEQTFMMKKQRSLAVEAKKEQDILWELIKLVLVREKEQHGTSMVQGRDGGSDCLKSQLGVSKLIRPPNVEEVIQEFTKQYQFIKRKRPPTTTSAAPSIAPPTTAPPTTAPPLSTPLQTIITSVTTTSAIEPTTSTPLTTTASAPMMAIPTPAAAPQAIVAPIVLVEEKVTPKESDVVKTERKNGDLNNENEIKNKTESNNLKTGKQINTNNKSLEKLEEVQKSSKETNKFNHNETKMENNKNLQESNKENKTQEIEKEKKEMLQEIDLQTKEKEQCKEGTEKKDEITKGNNLLKQKELNDLKVQNSNENDKQVKTEVPEVNADNNHTHTKEITNGKIMPTKLEKISEILNDLKDEWDPNTDLEDKKEDDKKSQNLSNEKEKKREGEISSEFNINAEGKSEMEPNIKQQENIISDQMADIERSHKVENSTTEANIVNITKDMENSKTKHGDISEGDSDLKTSEANKFNHNETKIENNKNLQESKKENKTTEKPQQTTNTPVEVISITDIVHDSDGNTTRPGFVDVGVQTDIAGLLFDVHNCKCLCHHK